MPIASTAGATISARPRAELSASVRLKAESRQRRFLQALIPQGTEPPQGHAQLLKRVSALQRAEHPRPRHGSSGQLNSAPFGAPLPRASGEANDCVPLARARPFPLTEGGTHRKQADYCAGKQHACVTVIGEAEKVTHTFHCRNSLSQHGALHAPST
jgi:hypothetical protein